MFAKTKLTICLSWLIILTVSLKGVTQEKNPLEGRWDLIINKDGKELPSWLEIRHSGYSTYVGRFVYASGSARPISEIKIKDGKFNFSIPPQWEKDAQRNIDIEGEMVGDGLKGTMVFVDGNMYNWVGTRVPILPYLSNQEWENPIKLFNGTDLNGWKALGENQWIVEDGILKSSKSGSNLVSTQEFMDFKLRADFRYPEGSNSGIYLRGRYEVQIIDSKEKEPSDVLFGGVYGFLTPNEMMAQNPDEWQTFDITLVGNRVTIVANGVAVITDQIIPGITGGALNSREGEPGPILIQGDHGPIEFKNITVMSLKKN